MTLVSPCKYIWDEESVKTELTDSTFLRHSKLSKSLIKHITNKF